MENERKKTHFKILKLIIRYLTCCSIKTVTGLQAFPKNISIVELQAPNGFHLTLVTSLWSIHFVFVVDDSP